VPHPRDAFAYRGPREQVFVCGVVVARVGNHKCPPVFALAFVLPVKLQRKRHSERSEVEEPAVAFLVALASTPNKSCHPEQSEGPAVALAVAFALVVAGCPPLRRILFLSLM